MPTGLHTGWSTGPGLKKLRRGSATVGILGLFQHWYERNVIRSNAGCAVFYNAINPSSGFQARLANIVKSSL